MRVSSPGLDDRQELGLRVDRQLLQVEPAHRLLGLPTANDNRADGAHVSVAQLATAWKDRGESIGQGLTADVYLNIGKILLCLKHRQRILSPTEVITLTDY